MSEFTQVFEFTPVDGTYHIDRPRADVEYLGDRFDIRKTRDLPRGCIDPMSFVYETPEDQMAAYAFSRFWVGRVRLC